MMEKKAPDICSYSFSGIHNEKCFICLENIGQAIYQQESCLMLPDSGVSLKLPPRITKSVLQNLKKGPEYPINLASNEGIVKGKIPFQTPSIWKEALYHQEIIVQEPNTGTKPVLILSRKSKETKIQTASNSKKCLEKPKEKMKIVKEIHEPDAKKDEDTCNYDDFESQIKQPKESQKLTSYINHTEESKISIKKKPLTSI